jgi:hypothetical protein
VIDHVIACCQGNATSRLNPATVLDSLQVTFDVHNALLAPDQTTVNR